MKDVLVIGSDGKLGSGLFEKIKDRAIGTSRKSSSQTAVLHLDLLSHESIQNLINVPTFKVAILVAAISDPDECFVNQNLSKAINVDAPIEILKILKRKSIKPIFISTEMVFDGQKGFYSELDKPNPTLIYGKQKLVVEEYIQKNFIDYIIIRLSKIYSEVNNDNSILNAFYSDITSNKVARYARDQYFTPTLQNDFELAVSSLIDRNLSGIFHLSSGSRINRWRFFELFAKRIGNFGKVQPCSLSDIRFLEMRPIDLSLNGDKLSKATSVNFATPEVGIDKWISINKPWSINAKQ
jgi:dTDP-4-dehydrorhamnose reductase